MERDGSTQNEGKSNENIPAFYFELDCETISEKHACELFRSLTVIILNSLDGLIDRTTN